MKDVEVGRFLFYERFCAMVKAWLVPGTHAVCIHVDVQGKQAECPVTYERNGIGLVVAPIDFAIRKQLLEFPGLLQMVRAYDERISCLKLSES